MSKASERYDQCDETCTIDCGHCKGRGVPVSGDPVDQAGEARWAVRCSCGRRFTGTPDAVETFGRQHDDSPLSSHIVSWDVPGVKPWTRGEVSS